MKIVGCDLHTRYQQIAMLDEETGELIERRLEHASGEAKEFYTKLSGQVRVGIEATGHTRWFEAGGPIKGSHSWFSLDELCPTHRTVLSRDGWESNEPNPAPDPPTADSCLPPLWKTLVKRRQLKIVPNSFIPRKKKVPSNLRTISTKSP